jgi:hypothetical protein
MSPGAPKPERSSSSGASALVIVGPEQGLPIRWGTSLDATPEHDWLEDRHEWGDRILFAPNPRPSSAARCR